MQVVKKLQIDNFINLKIFGKGNTVRLAFSSNNSKFISKLHITTQVLSNDKLFFFNNLKKNNIVKLVNYIKSITYKLFYEKYNEFSKLHLIGLGFKNFVLGNKLYILVGDCNYIIFNIPSTLKIFCKKNQIYFLSPNESDIIDFAYHIKKIKKPNFYKGKGVLEFKNFKFTKLKVGKKQRFM